MPKDKKKEAFDFVCYYLTCDDWEVHTEDIDQFKESLFLLYPDLKKKVKAYEKEQMEDEDSDEDDE